MHTLVIILQAILAVVLLVLVAITEDKNEQGGVMGLGAAGGRSAGEVDMVVGAERIIKPATRWVGGAFLAVSVVAAFPAGAVTIWHILITAAIYVVCMLYGGIAWDIICGTRQKVS